MRVYFIVLNLNDLRYFEVIICLVLGGVVIKFIYKVLVIGDILKIIGLFGDFFL